MSPVTLPGDIPGLVRRCSPVVYEGGSWVVWEVSHGAALLEEDSAPDLRWLRLDLSDPTGQAHAAWWATEAHAIRWWAKDLARMLMAAHKGKLDRSGQVQLRDLVLRLAGRSA